LLSPAGANVPRRTFDLHPPIAALVSSENRGPRQCEIDKNPRAADSNLLALRELCPKRVFITAVTILIKTLKGIGVSQTSGAGDADNLDGVGNVVSQTPAGITTAFHYNLDDQLTVTTNAKGCKTIDDVGVMGQVLAQYDPNQVPTYFGYDNDFRQTATALGTGAVTTFTAA
jgi:YD repeat-containing protein